MITKLNAHQLCTYKFNLHYNKYIIKFYRMYLFFLKIWYNLIGDNMTKVTVIKEKKDTRFIKNKFIEWLLYMICYAIVLITVSIMFDSLYISNKFFGFYAFLAAVIIYILNQTIKPVLFYITLPVTALTWGLFYPLINVLILYITSFILGDKFELKGIIIPFFIAILISIFNILMEGLIIKPIIRKKAGKNE